MIELHCVIIPIVHCYEEQMKGIGPTGHHAMESFASEMSIDRKMKGVFIGHRDKSHPDFRPPVLPVE
jgi:hypothetical protein